MPSTLALCVSSSYLLYFFCAFYFLIVKGFGYSYQTFLSELRKEFEILLVVIAAVACYRFLSPAIVNMTAGISSILLSNVLSLIIKASYLFVVYAFVSDSGIQTVPEITGLR